jgi:predicted ATPase
VATKPVLLILEDIQWMDMNSTLLALEALQNVKPISVVLTSRKMATPPSPAYVKLRAQCKELISLNLLPPSECVAIAANVLGVANLDDTVKHVLQSILNNIPGNPFFVQEFALGLLEAGEIIIEDGQCTISDTLGSNMHLLPTNVTAVISSRIDRLGTSAQMVLKVGMSRNRSPITAVPTEQPLISACFVVQLRSLERNSRCRS